MAAFFRSRLRSYLTWLVILISSIFIVRLLLSHVDDLGPALQYLNWFQVFSSLLFYLGYLYLRASSWGLIVESLGGKLALKESLFIWFFGESARYIPGNIWSFANRFYLSSGKGLNKAEISLSLALEVLTLLTITSLISLPALFLTGKQAFLNWLLLAVIVASLIGLFGLVFFSKRLRGLFKELANLSPKILVSSKFGGAVISQVGAWLLFGIATKLLVDQFPSHINNLVLVSSVVLAWLTGYLSLVTPSGIAVREVAVVMLLTPAIGVGPAGIVAVLSRVNLVLVEIINLLIWFYLYKRQQFNKLIETIFKSWDKIILLIFIIGYAVIFSRLSMLRHDAFASNFDLANMSQTVWNTLHGRPFELSGAGNTISRFSIHADLILILLSPLYLIWERAYALLVTQSVALALGAIPVCFLTIKILEKLHKLNKTILKIVALTFSLIYLLNPSMEWANLYDFHGVTLAIPTLLSTFYFALTRNWKWYWLFYGLSIFTKEEVSLLLALIGLVVFLIFKNWRVGGLSFLIGIIWFIVMVFLVIPHFSANGQDWGVNSLYGPAKAKILNSHSVLQSWDIFQSYFLSSESFHYYVNLLKPFAFLPLLGAPWLLLSSSEVAVNLLSDSPQMQSLTFHYDSGITPFIIIADIFGFFYLFWLISKLKWISKKINLVAGLFSLVLVAVALRINYHYSPLPTTPSCWCLSYRVSDEDRQFAQILTTIPQYASVTSSGEIRAHLTRRENSFTLPGGLDVSDYVAILDQNRIVGDYSLKPFETGLLKDPQFLSTHLLINHIGHFYLFKKIT